MAWNDSDTEDDDSDRLGSTRISQDDSDRLGLPADGGPGRPEDGDGDDAVVDHCPCSVCVCVCVGGCVGGWV